MSIQRLPSGRFRAQVYYEGCNLSVSRVLPDCDGTFATRAEAEQARELARHVLALRPPREKTPRPSVEFRLSSKGETQCRVCGADATHLHHIVPKVLSEDGRKDWQGNGLPLCEGCHRGWHNRALEIPHDLFTDAEFKRVCQLIDREWVAKHYAGEESVEDRWARVRRRRNFDKPAASRSEAV